MGAFQDVTITAEQITERHDPAPHDKDVEPIELPGLVNVYVNIDGGRLLLAQYKAGQVLDAIEAGKQAQAAQPQDTPADAPSPPPPPDQV